MKRLLAVVTVSLLLAGCSGNVFDLKVGDCLDEPAGEEITNVNRVDCSEPHDSELYATFDLAGDSYPGASVVEEAAVDGCLDAFEPYVGREYATSRLEVWWLEPSRESWSDGDREIACMLSEPGGVDFTGSMKDSGV